MSKWRVSFDAPKPSGGSMRNKKKNEDIRLLLLLGRHRRSFDKKENLLHLRTRRLLHIYGFYNRHRVVRFAKTLLIVIVSARKLQETR